MNYGFHTLLLSTGLFIQSNISLCTWEDKALIAGGVVVAAGSTYVLSKAYAHVLIAAAQTRFATERALLNHYAQFKDSWNTILDQQLKTYLKTEIIRLHNTNAHKWSITILYELSQGQPSYNVDTKYINFPLLQHKYDLEWYLKRLKIIRCLSLSSDYNELTMLIDQLTYIKEYIVSDYDYNKEGLAFSNGLGYPQSFK